MIDLSTIPNAIRVGLGSCGFLVHGVPGIHAYIQIVRIFVRITTNKNVELFHFLTL